MHVLIVSCVYPPEPVVSARTSHGLCRELLARGHQVTVIAPFPSRPARKMYSGFSRKLFCNEQMRDGSRLIRCFSFFSGHSRIWSRFLENASFGITSSMAVMFAGPMDVIYCNTWPLVAGALLRLAALLHRIPVAITIQDIYPESLVEQGRIRKGGWLEYLLKLVDVWIVSGCRQVLVLSERYARVYREERGVPEERLKIVPNWAESVMVAAASGKSMEFRHNHGIGMDEFVGVYGGNVGAAAGVETLVDAFRSVKEMEGWCLLIAGEGSRLAECQRRAAEIPHARILFHHPYLADETGLVLGVADVFLLPTQGKQSAVSMPSKMAAYLLNGRPVIAMAIENSDVTEVIRKSGAGWVIEPDRPDLLARKLAEVRQMDRNKLDQMGASGRAYAQAHFTPAACLPRVVEALGEACGKSA